MRPTRRAAAVVLAASLVAIACGDDDDASSAPDATASVPPIVAVEQAAEHDGELVALEGFFVAAPETVHRLCSALAESYPPQCAGARVEVVGLDRRLLTQASSNDDLPEGERTLWTDDVIRLTGTIDGERVVLPSPGDTGLIVFEAMAGSEPAAGASVELWGPGDAVATAVTDEVGTAVFRVSAGTFRLVALPFGDLSAPPPATAAAGEWIRVDYTGR